MAQAPLETVQVETSQSVPAGTVCRPNNDPYLSFDSKRGFLQENHQGQGTRRLASILNHSCSVFAETPTSPHALPQL